MIFIILIYCDFHYHIYKFLPINDFYHFDHHFILVFIIVILIVFIFYDLLFYFYHYIYDF